MTSPSDRDRLRRLAAEYAEMATNAVIDDRREIWRRTNMLEERTVPFQIEDNGTFFADLLPELQCEGAFERGIEAQMVRALTNHRLIDDDRVFPPFLGISWIVGRTSVCPEVEITRAADATGRELGYETNTPMADLANSLHKLVPTESSVNRDETHRLAELAGDLVGDILPVKIIGHHMTYAGTSLAQRAVHLMGMDGFYMAMIDQPENVHAFFEFLAADGERYVDWLEAEGLVTLNNRDLDVGSGSCGYTDEIPNRELANGDKALAQDCWGWIEAQEAIGLSPEMYAEFIHPYQRRVADRLGLVYYGCCEPVHHFWDTLKGFSNMRKVTVSPWCDQESIAASAGRDVVLSRKPHPMKLTAATFDAADFEAHIQETLDFAESNFVELIFRDTCALSGAMQARVAEACRIVRRLIDREN